MLTISRARIGLTPRAVDAKGSPAMRAKLFFSALVACLGLLGAYACSNKDDVIEVTEPNCPDAAPLPPSATAGDGAAAGYGAAAGDAGFSTACEVPEAKNCNYVGSGVVCEPKTYTAKCVAKKWVVTPGAINEPGCPSTIPAVGQTCPSCFNSATNCTYSFRCNGVQTDNAFSAQCVGGNWKVTRNTSCLVGDAGTD